jgi:hypothetical protein
MVDELLIISPVRIENSSKFSGWCMTEELSMVTRGYAE